MRNLAHLGVILLMACLIFGCSGEKQEANQTPSATAGETWAKAEAGLVTFAAVDTRGQLRQSSEWIGKQPTVINFWGTWCPPCRREIPDLVRLYEEYHPRGVEIIGLAVNDQPAKVEVFSNEAGMDWVMLMGHDEVAAAYGGITGVPTTIFLDKEGKEIGRMVGARSYADFKPAFDSILAGYQPAAESAGM